ncbi:MAG: hypothetical protein ACRC92_24115 [Peptostreptococcaceae bacterium]
MKINKLKSNYEFRCITGVQTTESMIDKVDTVLLKIPPNRETINSRFNNIIYSAVSLCNEGMFGATVNCTDDNGVVHFTSVIKKEIPEDDYEISIKRTDEFEITTANGVELNKELISEAMLLINGEGSMFYEDEMYDGITNTMIEVEHRYGNTNQDFTCVGTRGRVFNMNERGHMSYRYTEDITVDY